MNTVQPIVAEAPAWAPHMIPLMPEIYKWLAPARQDPRGLGPDKLKPHLCYIICSEDSQLIATDGYRMHVYPMDPHPIHGAHTPGFYAWDKNHRALVQIDESDLTPKMYRRDQLIYSGFINACKGVGALQLYSWNEDAGTVIRGFEWPDVRPHGLTVTLRRLVYQSQPCAMIMGANVAPVDVGADGEARIMPRSAYVWVEASYFADALSWAKVVPIARWPHERGPLIVGSIDGPHAIIMPKFKRN